MKIVIGIIVVVALVAGAAYALHLGPWSVAASPSSPSATPSPTAKPTSPATSPTPTATVKPPGTGNVKFDFAVTNVAGSGLSRTVTAQLSNTGTADAHNVWAKVEATSGGSKISLNGQDYVRVDIGLIKAGGSVVKEVNLSFSITDAMRITQQGVRLALTLTSDEGTEAFSYDYKP